MLSHSSPIKNITWVITYILLLSYPNCNKSKSGTSVYASNKNEKLIYVNKSSVICQSMYLHFSSRKAKENISNAKMLNAKMLIFQINIIEILHHSRTFSKHVFFVYHSWPLHTIHSGIIVYSLFLFFLLNTCYFICILLSCLTENARKKIKHKVFLLWG